MNTKHINVSTAWSEAPKLKQRLCPAFSNSSISLIQLNSPELPGYITCCGPQCLDTLQAMC